jgi:hypothetical protein
MVMTELPVRNVGDDSVCLFLEPLGNDYYMRPGDHFLVRGGAVDPHFEVNVMPGYLIVVINGGDPYDIEIIDVSSGAVLEVGHGRPE